MRSNHIGQLRRDVDALCVEQTLLIKRLKLVNAIASVALAVSLSAVAFLLFGS